MFNLSKKSQNPPDSAISDMWSAGELGGIEQQLGGEADRQLASGRGQGQGEGEDFDPKNLTDRNLQDKAEHLVDDKTLMAVHSFLKGQGQHGPIVWQQLIQELAGDSVANQSRYFQVADEIQANDALAALAPKIDRDIEANVLGGPLGGKIRRLLTQAREQTDPSQQLQVANFNLKKVKVAQMPEPSNFPVVNAGDLAAKFMDRMVTNDYESYMHAANELLSAVRGEIQEEEVNSAVESLWQLNDDEQARANYIFGRIWDLLPMNLKATDTMEQPMEPVMSEKNPKGIIKFNLFDHVLNNQNIMVKTSGQRGGEEYLLYGPTEKRICPKLRGRGGGQPGSSDVVSEYICRHHCLDGIVIDDNKTVCGEALWRAHVMDKQSREYVDADGNITGGYIEKRFEVNHNVPEENKMRLKPGETRKPRPAAWGSLESRMQDMRNKEGEKRGFRPDTNTGKPFEWCHDVDQNNVEVSQKERDRRETASGHQTVQYTNKDQQENNPKILTATHHSFTGGPLTPRTYEEMGNGFSPEGPYGHCSACKRRVLAKQLITEETEGRRFSVCSGCVSSPRRGFNLQQQKSATGGIQLAVPQKARPLEPKDPKIREDDKRPLSQGKKAFKEAAVVENDDIKKLESKTFPEDSTGCVTCTESGEMPEKTSSKAGFNLKSAKKKS